MSKILRRRTADIVLAVAIAVGAVIPLVAWYGEDSAFSSSLIGHLLGVAGLSLMLWSGFAYTKRKRSSEPGASMQDAMRLHVLAGLVGPWLVLLHSGFVFRGLAGVLTLLMMVVVLSGMVGRFAYTAVPRVVVTGDPVRTAMLDAELARLEVQVAERVTAGENDPAAAAGLRERLTALRHEQEVLHSQYVQPSGAAVMRPALGFWWYLHVPLSMGLWVLAIAHIVATLYYATLSR